MKKNVILLILLIPLGVLHSQTFQPFIAYLNSLPENERQAKVDSFMNATQTYPYVELDTLCHFIYKGNVQSASVAGDFSGWNPNLSMANIPGTDFWYLDAYYEADARLDYKFVLNGSNWVVDPLNPFTCTGGFGPNSELRMPSYVVPPEISYYPSIPHGIIKDTSFQSSNLGNSRNVRIYLPPGYSAQKQYPVVLFHDGPEYITLGNANNILDYLIAQKQIEPVIGIFVPPVNRTDEYAGNKKDAFTAFIVNELMPVIDQKYATSKDPHRRATIGASNGGNISLYIGMKHPEAFGKIAAQSSNVQDVISSTYQYGSKMDLTLYMDVGTYDIAILIPLVKNFVDILKNKGYAYQFHEWHEGHSWGNWKGHLSLPLIQFFPYPAGTNMNVSPSNINLYQNNPNPFSTSTRIMFSAPSGSEAELTIFDASGKIIDQPFKGKMHTENKTVSFTNPGAGNGTLICSLKVNGHVLTKKMILIH